MAEAAIVRRIFDDFVTVRSATMMVRNYASEGVVTKSGKPFCKQTIYKMLYNRMYRGEIVHKAAMVRGFEKPRCAGAAGLRCRDAAVRRCFGGHPCWVAGSRFWASNGLELMKLQIFAR